MTTRIIVQERVTRVTVAEPVARRIVVTKQVGARVIKVGVVGAQGVQGAQGERGVPGRDGASGGKLSDDQQPTLGGDLRLNAHRIIGSLSTNLFGLDGGLVES